MPRENNKSVLRKVDDQARLQAKNLIRTARFAALACFDTENNDPLISQVNVVADVDGAPGFLSSSLSRHFNALITKPRCVMLFGIPGKGDPAAHPRVSVTGEAYQVEGAYEIESIRRRFLARHPKSSLYVDFNDFAFWRVNPIRASLNGGFGKAYEMTANDILSSPKKIYSSLKQIEANIIADMNNNHSDTIELYATRLLNQQPGHWLLASLDSEGIDLVLGDKVSRLWFEEPITKADELPLLLQQLTQLANIQGKH